MKQKENGIIKYFPQLSTGNFSHEKQTFPLNSSYELDNEEEKYFIKVCVSNFYVYLSAGILPVFP